MMNPEEDPIFIEGSVIQAPLAFFKRYRIYFFLSLCFLFPLILVTFYAHQVPGIFLIALLSALLGGGGGWFIWKEWQEQLFRSTKRLIRKKVEAAVGASKEEVGELVRLKELAQEEKKGSEHQVQFLKTALLKSQEEVFQLQLQMDKKLEETRIAYHGFEDLRKEYRRLEEELNRLHGERKVELEQRETLMKEYHQTLTEQRMLIEKKQRYIGILEGRVGDLMDELRSVLQLEEVSKERVLVKGSAHHTPYDFDVKLRQCVERTENFLGVNHLGGKSPRFLDGSMNYAVDMRPLFDGFREEEGTIFIYSPEERKFLFVSDSIKRVLGVSPERFMKEFSHLVTRGYEVWKEPQISKHPVSLSILNKRGEEVPFTCYRRVITKGPFAQKVMGIFVS